MGTHLLLTAKTELPGIIGMALVVGVGVAVLFALTANAWRKGRHTLPSAEEVKQGQQLYSRIGGRSGAILGKDRTLTWKADGSLHLLRKSAFVVVDSDEKELLWVEKRRRLSLSFEMMEAGQHIGTVRLLSFLLNKYTLELKDGVTWTFHLPLYTVYFRADSTTGERVWMQVGPRTKLQWMVLVRPEFNDVRVLSAIAFIHRRWYL